LAKRSVVLLEWMTRINWADVLAIIILIFSSYIGSQRGFFGEFFYILGACFTIVFALHFYGAVSNFFHSYLFLHLNVSDLIGFLIIIFIFYFLFTRVDKFLYSQKIIKIEIFHLINKISGAVLGFCRGFVVSALIFFIMLLIPLSYIIDSAKTRSLFGPFFIKAGTTLYKKSLSLVSGVEERDLTRLLSGAEPLKFKIFQLKRKDKLDEILQ